MMYEINETHDPNLRCWVESANDPNSDFPIQNLPFCWFFRKDDSEQVETAGIIIGDMVLDLAECLYDDLFTKKGSSEYQAVSGFTSSDSLNWAVSTTSEEASRWMRTKLVDLLRDSSPITSQNLLRKNMLPLSEVEFGVPLDIGDYTDFYCSIYHATNVGSMFRPDNPLMPNYKYVPIGYHGRASSIVVSGTDIKRPNGQNRSNQEKPPVFGPCKNLDYEMELGFFVSRGNELGQPIPISEAEEHIFGVCLVNDWSARDIQAWEYQPLGPFLAKNFATTISPYVVTMEALAPFRTKAFQRDTDDPQPLEYLSDANNEEFGGLDINLEVYIQTEKMLTHHASNGCNLQTGDLIATGTVSGKEKHERGCMLELTWRGKEPIDLPSGEQRRFLEDGDEIIMKGFCEREGFRRIGLGECRGRIMPAE